MFPQGDTTDPISRGLVFPEGDIADPNVQRGYRRVGTVDFCHFSGSVGADSCVFSLTSKEDLGREIKGSDLRRALEA